MGWEIIHSGYQSNQPENISPTQLVYKNENLLKSNIKITITVTIKMFIKNIKKKLFKLHTKKIY